MMVRRSFLHGPALRTMLGIVALACVIAIPLDGADAASNSAGRGSVYSTSPRLDDGKKWRIAYYEGGAHTNYYHYLRATVSGLMDLGWLEKADVPAEHDRVKDTRALWEWVSKDLRSDFIEFLSDGYYSANWNNVERGQVRDRVVARLRDQEDVNLMIAMGTWAGQDLANDLHAVPTIVMSSSDPVKSGIIESNEDSGRGHVHARVDPLRYERQVRVFHDIVHFSRLGVAYENSVVGRSYAAIDLVERVAAERGFEVVRCFTKSDIADARVAGDSVLECFEKLAGNVDAIYVTVQGGVNAETIPQLVRLVNQHRIPTFSQLGSDEVRNGFLLSISRAGGFKPVGLFMAATVAKIFNGAQPRELTQVFEETPNIAINLKSAEVVGLYLYADVLAAADEIYREISLPD